MFKSVTMENKGAGEVPELEKDLNFIVGPQNKSILLGDTIPLMHWWQLPVAANHPAKFRVDMDRMPPSARFVNQTPDFGFPETGLRQRLVTVKKLVINLPGPVTPFKFKCFYGCLRQNVVRNWRRGATHPVLQSYLRLFRPR